RGAVPGRPMRRLPVEIISDSAATPFRHMCVVERRTAIVTGRDGIRRIRLFDYEAADFELRHLGLAPREGYDIGARLRGLVGKGHLRGRAESEAVTGAEQMPFAGL